jgi:hypothetical protein
LGARCRLTGSGGLLRRGRGGLAGAVLTRLGRSLGLGRRRGCAKADR